jgi:hypothetical protein
MSMDLRNLKARINRLLEDQSPPIGPPACIVLLPGKDGRGPAADEGKPLPRIAWRNRRAACIFYDQDAGQPSREEIAELLAVQS